jgi:hypothetical protein
VLLYPAGSLEKSKKMSADFTVFTDAKMKGALASAEVPLKREHFR